MESISGKSAEELKVLGNDAFAKHDYDNAIQYYTKAIQKEPNNHVYYSNRSASYAGLEKWELAIHDAKECIRHNPSFIKGYYRLATAYVGQQQYDIAIQTIRQGLRLEPNNTQLTKQLRTIQQQQQQQKRQQAVATTSKQQPPSLDSSGSLPTTLTLDPQTAMEYKELQNQYTQMFQKYQALQTNINKSQREVKVANITCQELQSIQQQDETKGKDHSSSCYRGVGKLFVKSSIKDMIQLLEHRQVEEETFVTDHTKQIEYMEKQLISIRQNMNEIIQKVQ